MRTVDPSCLERKHVAYRRASLATYHREPFADGVDGETRMRSTFGPLGLWLGLLPATASAGLTEPAVGLSNPEVVPSPAFAGAPLTLRFLSDGCSDGDPPPTFTRTGITIHAV